MINNIIIEIPIAREKQSDEYTYKLDTLQVLTYGENDYITEYSMNREIQKAHQLAKFLDEYTSSYFMVALITKLTELYPDHIILKD